MAKSQHFVAKIVPLFKAIVCELCLRFFSSVFSFCKDVSFIDHAPGVWLLDDWKLAINWKKRQWRHNCLTSRYRQFFWHCRVSLVKFSYWYKFHVNITTVMTIFVYKRLTRNLEIKNTPFWVLLNIWRLERVRDIKFGMNVFNKMLLNAAKCQGYLYHFWVIKGKPRLG